MFRNCLQPFMVILIISSLLVGLAVRVYWQKGGPDWAYWLSSLTMSIFVMTSGTLVAIRRNIIRRTSGTLFGIALVIIGLYLFINTVRLWLIGCLPPSC